LSSHPEHLVNTRLLMGGAVLTGIGGTIATLGLALGSAAVIGAGRRWQQRTEMTPAQLAKHAVGAAQVATNAGYGAWRGPLPVPAQRSSSEQAVSPVS
jgi:hypothetical protein